jgi:ATP-dependent exoDNAse (exonuclease V) alpha subunit
MELTEGQALAMRLITEEKVSVFVEGPAGSGKSWIISRIPSAGLARTASTGQAACLIGGRTLHSLAGIVPNCQDPAELIVAGFHKAKLREWTSMKALLIDEISMVGADLLDLVDEIARIARKRPNVPFGGLQVILVGDLYQLPPINSEPVFKAKVWDKLFPDGRGVVQLTEVMRQNDPAWIQALNSVRVGVLTDEAKALIRSRLVPFKDTKGTGVYPTAILPTRRQVEDVNQMRLAELDGELKTFEAVVKPLAPFGKGGPHPSEVSRVVENGPLEKQLRLKVGAQVMFTVNDPAGQFFNGARGVVEEILPDYIVVRRPCGEEVRTKTILRDFSPSVKCTVEQFPLKLAWGVTTHKSQGMTLDLAEVDLGTSNFSPGQVYVALSRVRDISNLYVRAFHSSVFKCDPRVAAFFGEPPCKKPKLSPSSS